MGQVGARLLFLLVSSAIMVFFSEKAYWYVQGYELLGLVLFYAFPAFVCLWAIQAFRVKTLSALFLCGALYGFVVEGVIVTLIYEQGLWAWFHVSYTPLAWHAPISVVFGWYYLRKLLISGSMKRLVGWCCAFGTFWGCWSLVYTIDLGEGEGVLGAWPVWSFAAYVFTFGAVLAACHWAFGRVWLRAFEPSKAERWAVSAIIVAYFALGTAPQVPTMWFKLPVLLAVTLLALWSNRRKEREGSLLSELGGRVPLSRATALLCMPCVATLVYALVLSVGPSENLIRTVFYEGIVVTTGYAGAVLYLGALAVCVAGRPRGCSFRPQRESR